MKYIWIALVVLVLQGCATPYQKDGFKGGFSETQLDENVFNVSFKGNGNTGRERVSDFTLLRSAELATQSGYNYFVVIASENYRSYSMSTASDGQTYNISKPNSSNTIVCFKDKPENGFSYNAEFISASIKEKYGIAPESN